MCVIGTAPDGTDKHTYHSQDGENWTEAILPISDSEKVMNVIYAPNLYKNFILRVSGKTNYLYTLSINDL